MKYHIHTVLKRLFYPFFCTGLNSFIQKLDGLNTKRLNKHASRTITYWEVRDLAPPKQVPRWMIEQNSYVRPTVTVAHSQPPQPSSDDQGSGFIPPNMYKNMYTFDDCDHSSSP